MPPNSLTSSLSLIACADIATQTKQRNGLQVGKKDEVCNEIIKRLRDINHEESLSSLDFADSIRAHFNRLPYRYALEVNIERAEEVLTHQRLLALAEDPEHRPAFSIRSVHALITGSDNLGDCSQKNDGAARLFPKPKSFHPPSAFGFPTNLDTFSFELSKLSPNDGDKENNDIGYPPAEFKHGPIHEVTFSTVDKPKLLSKLSSLLADVGLNIREAHAFSTVDGYSLDVFVVGGWPTESTEELQQALESAIASVEETYWERVSPTASPADYITKPDTPHVENSTILCDGADDWEINYNQLKLNCKVASGSFGDLYKGTYRGQEVAIKVLRPERTSIDIQKEFAQEVRILKKVRHKNVVQFIGACTKPLHRCIVTEFMSGGSVYDNLHNQRGVFKLPVLIRVAIDISKGMDYLHQHNIIHRDLKAANLLMDEHEVVKVADFGVARIQSQTGIMTAETGTYRWMAPEVIEHKPYDRKADVFSFGIVLWELLTGKLPYEYLTPLQAAVGVVQRGLRPTIPKSTNPKLSELLEKCWKQDPKERPEFSEITVLLQNILREVGNDDRKDRKGNFFSAIRRT